MFEKDGFLSKFRTSLGLALLFFFFSLLFPLFPLYWLVLVGAERERDKGTRKEGGFILLKNVILCLKGAVFDQYYISTHF